MWCIKREYEKGIYQDEAGKRYMVVFCDRVITHPDKKIEDLGYVKFNSREECLKTWKLELYKEPVKEEEQVVQVIDEKKLINPNKEKNLLLEKL
jgi:hypothetical protein